MKAAPPKIEDYKKEPDLTKEEPSDSANFISTEFLKPYELAAALGVSERTLARWHSMREGPPRIRKGRQIFYRKASVVAWLAKAEIATVRKSS